MNSRSSIVPREAAPRDRRQDFLGQVADRTSLEELRSGIDSFRRLRVAVVGEAIIDEYAYCDALGKSGKEPMLVTRFQRCEKQAGGALAIANHLAEFCDRVELVSALGSEDSQEGFVRRSLAAPVHARFVVKSGSPTIVKRRYMDAYSLAKMFGVYHIDDSLLAGADEDAFCEALGSVIPSSDLVLVADYGHGLITRRAVDYLARSAKFLMVNTQLNAANTGYHTVSKYPRADCVCLHEGELRLDARDLHGPLEELMEDAAKRLGAWAVMITRGKNGTLLYLRGGGFFACPSLATTVLERVGAGDAVLAMTALATAAGLSPTEVGLLANLAGAQAVSVLGNSTSIRKRVLLEDLARLLPCQQHRKAGGG